MPTPTLKHPPLVRVLRTVLAVIVGLAGLTPAVVQLVEAVGVDQVPTPAVLAVASVATLVATKVNAVLSDAGNRPVMRTIHQVLVALAGLAAGAVASLAAGGIHLDPAQITSILGALIVLVAAVQNLLEHRGTIPTDVGGTS